MATRDANWPGYTQWHCCPSCRRLWTLQATEMVVLDPSLALGPAIPTPGVPARTCASCEGRYSSVAAEI